MSAARPTCPACGTHLVLRQEGDKLHAWICSAGHGLGFTLSEAYERLQEDEIRRIWKLAKTAVATGRPSPFDGKPMAPVRVGLTADDSEAKAAPDATTVEIEVDVANEFIWFDPGELDEFPEDRSDPTPSAQEMAALGRIRTAFGESLAANWDVP